MAGAPVELWKLEQTPEGVSLPASLPMPAFSQANSLYLHENQWMEQIVLNYVKWY